MRGAVFAPWNAGATVFVYNWLRFNAKTILDVIVRYEVTTLCAPPTVWRQLLNENLANYPVQLREVVSSRASRSIEIIRHVEKRWELTIRDGYGQTETTATGWQYARRQDQAGGHGQSVARLRCRCWIRPAIRPTRERLRCRFDPHPMGLMLGYQDEWGKTIEPGSDGWYRTGDVAARDADGYCHYVGALMICSIVGVPDQPVRAGGVLTEHEAVAEAAVIASVDTAGLAPCQRAVIELRDGFAAKSALAEEILRFTRARLAPYKRIRRVEFSDLPKTMTGKVRRVDLRQREEELHRQARRADCEFWEEDFPSLVASE
ncbi:MAG: AMP-binding protein [Rhodospirillales bacterium]